ncbi:unnamed protein product (macronuclear) [Paramecium tetraurelia]|uniref:Uncharacterized protein n=1 Tax=Paramecium tetraurelia TaxID=5888 RepID=A0CNW8_PARTE|nr:uncharacterized protein GSPATT00038754001 [Paramecium tetraurelia]CAK72485.1 unnamed protein product [Paramecium tetraurelia]|eukprot:XP_001439882.1 hypothetical protein (macronuclear) [Paramecium tetraurelia strain d4-2]
MAQRSYQQYIQVWLKYRSTQQYFIHIPPKQQQFTLKQHAGMINFRSKTKHQLLQFNCNQHLIIRSLNKCIQLQIQRRNSLQTKYAIEKSQQVLKKGDEICQLGILHNFKYKQRQLHQSHNAQAETEVMLDNTIDLIKYDYIASIEVTS